MSKGYTSYFELKESEKIEGKLAICDGNINKKSMQCTSHMIYMPKTLSDKIRGEASGFLSPTIVGLLEYAISQLEDKKKTLFLNKKNN